MRNECMDNFSFPIWFRKREMIPTLISHNSPTTSWCGWLYFIIFFTKRKQKNNKRKMLNLQHKYNCTTTPHMRVGPTQPHCMSSTPICLGVVQQLG
jgi:hypothetical protein